MSFKLSTAELLTAWERAVPLPPAGRALALLAAVLPEAAPDSLAQFSIGQRDALLLAIRAAVFGPHLVSLATCPQCGERLELNFDVNDIQSRPLEAGLVPNLAPTDLEIDGYHLSIRPINSLDLAEVPTEGDLSQVQNQLLERCLVSSSGPPGSSQKQVNARDLPPPVLAALQQKLAQIDPQAIVTLDLTCPACSHPWQFVFDILSYFWSELNAWAVRTFQEVHALASAYGWREADILAMPPWRRQVYIELING
jgi:hypothetical protein